MVKGGLNLAKFHGDNGYFSSDYGTVDEKVKPGIAVGAALQLKFAGMFAIEPEFLFSSKGERIEANSDPEYSEESIDATYKIKTNYLEIPILFQFLIPAGPVTPMVYAGPAISFRIGRPDMEMTIDGETQSMSDDDRDDMDKSFTKFDFGLAMGGGLGIKAGPGNVVFDIRYTLGFLKIAKLTDEDKEEEMTESDLPKYKNGVFMIGAGYLFTF